jgi:hypothetical protein
MGRDGPNPNKKIKINVSKIYDFFYGILINIGLYFYTVKIEV